MAYDNTNRGVLFKNNNRKNDADPEYTGKLDVDGDEAPIIATRRKSGPRSKNPGSIFFAINFREEENGTDDFESANEAGGGAFFKNDRKTKSNQPDYKGSLSKNGVDYWASAWIKEAGPNSQNPGTKFMSIAIEPKLVTQPSTASQPSTYQSAADKIAAQREMAKVGDTPASFDDFDDDIPF